MSYLQGILSKNDNKTVEITSHLHKYVPLIECSDSYYIPRVGKTVQGVQGFSAPNSCGLRPAYNCQSRGAKIAKENADSPITRLGDLVSVYVAEDLNTKVVLFVCTYVPTSYCIFSLLSCLPLFA